MNRALTTAAVAAVQLVLIGVAVAPQASARLTGDSYLLSVGPVDPIDPYRGAYVALDYPDLRPPDAEPGSIGPGDDDHRGRLFVTLRNDGEVWVASGFTRSRPTSMPYLACDDGGWQVRCGIESWFVRQDEARRIEQELADGAYAEIRVDGRGHAALVDVRGTP
jgi:uncharacterized membrane-anchored protein